MVGEDDMFGSNTWEEAESSLQKDAVYLALEKSRMKPEDISLIGYDDTRQRIYNQKMISSISSFIDDQVSIGMAMLMKRISSTTSNAVQNVSLQTAFMPYETVGPCK